MTPSTDARPPNNEARAVVEWYWEDTDASTGEISRAEDAIAVDVADGRVRRWREYIDTESLAGAQD
ncbi:MAG: hypothetical protein ACFB5Z_04645 [Elainellaceae cyanobacterium]